MLVPDGDVLASANLQEAKEAVADALVGLVADRVSGSGPDGEVVYGRMPRAAFVSGLLLPRFDSTGEDDTSDVHISVLGIDAQVPRGVGGRLSVQPSFAVYVRVLPTWGEVQPQRDELAKRFSLTAECAARLGDLAAQLRREKESAAGIEPGPVSDKAQRRARREKRTAIRRAAYAEARALLGLPAVGVKSLSLCKSYVA